MEYTQWVFQDDILSYLKWCLNPCCNGIYSMRKQNLKLKWEEQVLILVVMEYTQWDYSNFSTWLSYSVS